MPTDVLGTLVFNQKTSEFNFKKGPIFSNIVLIDEINRSPAKTQAALLEVMEEQKVSMDGETHAMTFPFFVIATQNPIEQEGTYKLPEAQLDRFIFRIKLIILIWRKKNKFFIALKKISIIIRKKQCAQL